MKRFRKLSIILLLITLTAVSSCRKYLDKSQSADISEQEVFSNFNSYQGYVETMYDDVVNWIFGTNRFGEFNFGDDLVPTRKSGFLEGDYMWVIADGNSPYYNSAATRASGQWSSNTIRRHAIWQNSWFGIRAANIALQHLPDLVDATDEERRLIEGQAYFFRGYFHWEMMAAWGSVPYVDTVFAADADMRVPQMGFHETAEKVLRDLEKAAELLPEDWDNTTVGSATSGQNVGRATKGMALSFMTECLLFSASPLANGVSTGSYTYNTDYAKRAAEAAWRVIELANKGIYQLEPWTTYKDIFMRTDNNLPHSKEVIFTAPQRGNARYFSSSFTFGHVGTDNWYSAPSQNYVDLFEMNNGLPIEDPASGYDASDPWVNRDPRFEYNILLDGERMIKSLNDDRAFVQFYVGGREKTSVTSLTGYGWKKFWDITINKYDNGWNRYWFGVPRIRLADIYLMYAEAVNEAFGPTGTTPGSALTAADAVNIVRARANMPNVDNKFLGSKEAFRDRIWNERAVELAFESKRWYDLRRWHVAHLPKYRELYGLDFDKDHTYFQRVLVKTIEFSERHYWLPFPVSQVSMYPEWKQNPGW
jgi:starch-binding outer membrane protein, SusD/RagB family